MIADKKSNQILERVSGMKKYNSELKKRKEAELKEKKEFIDSIK